MRRKQRVKAILDFIKIFLLTAAVGTVLILACGASPAEAYRLFFRGMFGTFSSFAEIFVKACPLILTGLGCAVAFRAGFFNIGAEGQFYAGAMGTTVVALFLPDTFGVWRIVLAMAAGFVCGGLWALVAALLKAKFNISEIIVTIMLNYIIINFLGYAVRSFLMDPSGNVPQSAKIAVSARLPVLIPSTRFHAGILIAVCCVILVWFLMEKTTVGYELTVVGINKRAAACNGISGSKA
jgi:simple sugar transport system permease protein